MSMIEHKGRMLNTPARASLWYLAATVLSRGVGMLGTPIFTRLLSAEDYGLFALFTSITGIIQVPLGLELSGTVCYSALEKFRKGRRRLMWAASHITLLGAGAFLVLFLLFSRPLGDMLALADSLLFLAPIYSLCTAIISLYCAWMRYEYRYIRVCLINILLALGTPLLSFLFIKMGITGSGRMLGAALASLIIALPLFIIMQPRGAVPFPSAEGKYLLGSALPLLPHYIATSLIIRLGEIILANIQGGGAIAKFSVASSVGFSLTIVSASLLSSLGPWLVRRLNDGGVLRIRQIVNLSTLIISLAVILLSALAPELLSLLAPSEYSDAVLIVYPLSLSVLPMFLSGVFTTLSPHKKSGIKGSFPAILALSASVLSALLLVPLDYRLLGFSVLLAYSVLALALLYLVRRESGLVPLDIRKCLCTLALTVGYVILLALLRGHFIARLAIMLPLLPIIIHTASKAFSLMREIGNSSAHPYIE